MFKNHESDIFYFTKKLSSQGSNSRVDISMRQMPWSPSKTQTGARMGLEPPTFDFDRPSILSNITKKSAALTSGAKKQVITTLIQCLK
jgi:hypothetical protein